MEKAETPVPFMKSGALAGIADITESFRRVTHWTGLGWYEFAGRYHRTLIGPFWTSITVSVWILGLGFVFGNLLGDTTSDFLAYVTIGIVLWNYMSATLGGATAVFVGNEQLIVSVNNPLFTFVLRQFVVHGLRLFFQALVLLLVLPWTKIDYGPVMLLAIPGLVLLLFTSLWVIPLLGILGARFRDLSFILNSIMRFLFFTTPVFWRAESLGRHASVAVFNPFTHFLEIVRAPMLGVAPSLHSWTVVLGITTCGAVATLLIYTRFRREIVFWL